jgi:hypothetical protein
MGRRITQCYQWHSYPYLAPSQLAERLTRHAGTLDRLLDISTIQRLRGGVGLTDQGNGSTSTSPLASQTAINDVSPSTNVPPLRELVGSTNFRQGFSLEAIPGFDPQTSAMAPTGFFNFDFELPSYSLNALAEPSDLLTQMTSLDGTWDAGELWPQA